MKNTKYGAKQCETNILKYTVSPLFGA